MSIDEVGTAGLLALTAAFALVLFAGCIALAFAIAEWVDASTPPCAPPALTVYDQMGFKAGCAVTNG